MPKRANARHSRKTKPMRLLQVCPVEGGDRKLFNIDLPWFGRVNCTVEAKSPARAERLLFEYIANELDGREIVDHDGT